MNTHGKFEEMLTGEDRRRSRQRRDAPNYWNPQTPVAELNNFSDEELNRLIDCLSYAADSLGKTIASQNESCSDVARIWGKILQTEESIRQSAEELSQYASNILDIAHVRSLRSADHLESTISDLRRWESESRNRIPELSELMAVAHERDDDQPGSVIQLLVELGRMTALVETIGQEVRDLRLVPAILGAPLDEEDPGAIRDRIRVLKGLYEELEYQKREFLTPAIAEGQASLEILKTSGMNTDAFRHGLERGNVGAVVIVERILKDLVSEAQDSGREFDQGILKELDALACEVTQKIFDVRLQVVPSGMIRFARSISEGSHSRQEIQVRSQLIQEIINLVREYLGGS